MLQDGTGASGSAVSTSSGQGTTSTSTGGSSTSGGPAAAAVRIASGQTEAVTDAQGNLWQADGDFAGGTAYVNPGQAVSGTDTAALYDGQRFGDNATAFSYDFSLPAGDYTVLLKFTENFATAAGQRLFDVAIGGATVLSDFDIYAATGAQWAACDQAFNVAVTAGQTLSVAFSPGTAGNPKVDALAILPGANAAMTRCASGSPTSGTGSTTSSSAGTSSSSSSSSSSSGGASSSGTPQIEYFGRFDFSDPTAPKFAWEASAIRAQFLGSSVTTTLANLGGADQYFEVVQDGDYDAGTNQDVPAGKTVSITSTYPSTGSHQILIVKNTEFDEGDSQFMGFDFNGGQLQAPLAPVSSLRLETYGDSISAGYGDLGTSSACSYSTATESAFAAYTSVASQILGANPPNIIAVSGSTIDASSFSLLSYFDLQTSSTSWTWPTKASEQPNVVLINQGTNDVYQNFPYASITDALVSFGQTLRGHYPSATLVFLASPMLEIYFTAQAPAKEPAAVQAAVQQLVAGGDQNVQYLDLFANDPHFPGDDTLDGCNGHPNAADQALMGAHLANFLQGLGY